jgi:hypothetical protein
MTKLEWRNEDQPEDDCRRSAQASPEAARRRRGAFEYNAGYATTVDVDLRCVTHRLHRWSPALSRPFPLPSRPVHPLRL